MIKIKKIVSSILLLSTIVVPTIGASVPVQAVDKVETAVTNDSINTRGFGDKYAYANGVSAIVGTEFYLYVMRNGVQRPHRIVYDNPLYWIYPGHADPDQTQALQAALRGLGHYIEVDGSFGPATQRAVREFQNWAGVPGPDGTVGPVTWQKIQIELVRKYG